MEDQNAVKNHHLPVYNIKAVSRLVGLLPVTLRAWERRYGLPTPRRGDQGYRLYSEYDLRTLRWLKSQLDAGMSISRAVEYLAELKSNGIDPANVMVAPALDKPVSLENLAGQFKEALLTMNDQTAAEALRRAFSLYPVDEVLQDLLQPSLVEVGDLWHQGRLPIAVEHFATQFCMQHLMSMLANSAPPSRPGTIVAACAPGEMHQIGILMLVVMLRWRGWDVKYLGPDLKLDRLEEALKPIRPKLLMFTATRPESARALEEQLVEALENFEPPRPIVVVGGQGFEGDQPLRALPVERIASSPSKAVEMIEKRILEYPLSEK